MNDVEDTSPEPESPEASGEVRKTDLNWDKIIDGLGKLLGGVAFNHVFSKLLGIAVQAEVAVSDVVAIQLGRDEVCMDILAEEVVGHVPPDKRLKILERLISDRGWAADFPEVVPTLKRLQELRNRLAHSYDPDEGTAGLDDAVYHRRTYWRGQEKDFDIDVQEVFTLAEAVEKILSEDLAEIARRSLPQAETGSISETE